MTFIVLRKSSSNGKQYTAEVMYSFTGYYVKSMTEAYTAVTGIQQIAKFSNVYFEGRVFTSVGSKYSIPSWGNFNVYRMDQQHRGEEQYEIKTYNYIFDCQKSH